jgi:hypothetical protein
MELENRPLHKGDPSMTERRFDALSPAQFDSGGLSRKIRAA